MEMPNDWNRGGWRSQTSQAKKLVEVSGMLITKCVADSRQFIVNPFNLPDQSLGVIQLVLRPKPCGQEECVIMAIRKSSPPQRAVIRLEDIENYTIFGTISHEIELNAGVQATLYLSAGPQAKKFNEIVARRLDSLGIECSDLKCLVQMTAANSLKRQRTNNTRRGDDGDFRQQQKRHTVWECPEEYDLNNLYESIDQYVSDDVNNDRMYVSASAGDLFSMSSNDDCGVLYDNIRDPISASCADISHGSGVQRNVTQRQRDTYARSAKQRRHYNQKPQQVPPPRQPPSSVGSRVSNLTNERQPMSQFNQHRQGVFFRYPCSDQSSKYPPSVPSRNAANIRPPSREQMSNRRPAVSPFQAAAAQPEEENYSFEDAEQTNDESDQCDEMHLIDENEYANSEEFYQPFYDDRSQEYNVVPPGSKGNRGQFATTARPTVQNGVTKGRSAGRSSGGAADRRWENGYDDDVRENLAQRWECRKCQLDNHQDWALCEKCQAPRPGVALRPPCQCSKKGGTPKWRKSRGCENKCDKCGDWQCWCGVVNPRSDLLCITCGRRRK